MSTVAARECVGSEAPLVAREGETCFEFAAHERSLPDDRSKLLVPQGESLSQIYYDVPWQEAVVATRVGVELDNAAVVRHGFVFASRRAVQGDGTVAHNVTGTTLGEEAELLAAWAAGGCTLSLPDDVGLALPAPGAGKIMIQWHHYNVTGSVQLDATKFVICTVPASTRPHVAGLTMLGTEDFGQAGIPVGDHETSGTCSNRSQGPITVIGFMPHMHNLGVSMRSEARPVSGPPAAVFAEPFAWDHQVHYTLERPVVLAVGDALTSTCAYRNETPWKVSYGPSVHFEVCYQLALAYPHGALNNGVASLLGATNTCW